MILGLVAFGIIGWMGLSLMAIGIVFEGFRIHEETMSPELEFDFEERWAHLFGEDHRHE